MLIIWHKRNLPKFRCIRMFFCIAQKDYHCCRCICPIFPGECYFGKVMVFGRRLWVDRYHYLDCPDHPPDENYEAPEIPLDQFVSQAA